MGEDHHIELQLPTILHRLSGKTAKSVWLVTLSIFAIGMSLTTVALQRLYADDKRHNTHEVDSNINDSMAHIESALVSQANLLTSLQGLFHARGSVERKEFHQFVESIDIPSRYPSVSGLSWNTALAYDLRSQFEQDVREDTSLQKEGYPEFKIKPSVEAGKMAYVITYIEPMKTNEKAFGFDIGSNAERRLAVERARDNGRSVATAPITLVQQTGTQKGFLFIAPIYKDTKLETVSERRASFVGVVVGVFRLPILIGESISEIYDHVLINDITDLPSSSETKLVYVSGTTDTSQLYVSQRKLEIGGRTWQLDFGIENRRIQPSITMKEIGLALSGLLVSLLSSLIYWLLCETKTRAIVHADRLTRSLQTVNADLDRSNKDLRQFAYIASHDLQTPVRGIRVAVDCLAHELDDDSRSSVKGYLVHLRDSSDRLKNLLSDLLSYAQTNRGELQKTSIDLDKLMKRAVSQLKAQYGFSDESFRIQTPLSSVWGDETQVERLVTNLIGNAIKYRNPERDLDIFVSTEAGPDKSTLLIADNGVGIDEKYHLKVFEPFQRLHRHDEIEGTGLGLGICQQIVKNHSGRIYVAESSDEGTTFAVGFPNQQEK